MPSFQGNKVFRPQGQSVRTRDIDGQVSRLISQGGRAYRTQKGEVHIVSPSGGHWGTLSQTPDQKYQFHGGGLGKYEPEENSEDITESFNGR